MTKITKDCYVNVERWTEEEVKKAADIFAEATNTKVGDINTWDSYHYLMVGALDRLVFVGDFSTVEFCRRSTELTKEDIFGDQEPTTTLNINYLKSLTSSSPIEFTISSGVVEIFLWPKFSDPIIFKVKDEKDFEEFVKAWEFISKFYVEGM